MSTHDEDILKARVERLQTSEEILRRTLVLAQSHIGWCWDKLEEHTALRREGSAAIHERIAQALKAS